MSLAKLKTGEELRKRRDVIVAAWPELQRKIRKQIYSFDEMKAKFVSMGCPVTPPEIGADMASTRRAIYGAGMIRKRYTVLDTLLETGLTARIIDKVLNGRYFTF